MSTYRYGYKYAILRTSDGICRGLDDTTNYILRPDYIPITDDSVNFLLKYYYPMPTAPVTSFADFQGLFYYDAAHTQPFDEGNAALRHED